MRGCFTAARFAAALLATTVLFAGGAQAACQLNSAGSKITHVVYLQFDNVHLTRDNPNVPSEMEQMPNLLHFFEQNGSMMTMSHTQLISHTGTGFVSALSGLYGDRLGIPVANSTVLYNQNGEANGFPSVFAYWTALINDTTNFDTTHNMVGLDGKNTPAPWVTYTRAGCDVGAVAFANVELENVKTTARGDITTVFGNPSPEATEAKANATLAAADFEGLAIHCAVGSRLCGSSPNAKPDLLPDEPGGYNGFSALFGNKYIAPAIVGGTTVQDLNGAAITDGHGNPGFFGFDGSPEQVLGYAAAMLEANVPVVFVSLTDLHDNHTTASPKTFGPGEAGYVAQLADANQAFGTFFSRLANDGITPENTLFILTQDEGDHFSGQTQEHCDGIHVPCTYVHSGPQQNIGEVDADLLSLLAGEFNDTTPFNYHFDSAPTINVFGTPGPVFPAQNSPLVRDLERHVGALTGLDLINGQNTVLTQRIIDHAAMSALHMITSDPLRNATFIMFSNDDYFYQSPDNPISCTPISNCIFFDDGFAWNHGDFQEEIAHVQLGFAGPGVLRRGLDTVTWSDHTDVRPTIMALIGLQDDYKSDGRVLAEVLDPGAVALTLRQSVPVFVPLAQAFKRLNAPFQQFGIAMLQLSTQAILSGSDSNDSKYNQIEQEMDALTAQRNALVTQIETVLNGAAFGHTPINPIEAASLTFQANLLATQAAKLAGGATAE